MAQEGLYIIATHFPRMAPTMETDVANDPVDISLLSAEAVVAHPDFGADVVQEAAWWGHWIAIRALTS